MVLLQEGKEFNSIDTYEKAIVKWEKDNYVQLYKRSSRTIAVASRLVNTKKFNTTLQFAEIDYACIHGGRKAVSLSKGCSTNQK